MSVIKLSESDIQGKKVLLRADLDFNSEDTNNLRLKSLIPTIDFLKGKKCKVIVIGHRGRPDGKPDGALSLEPIAKLIDAKFVYDIVGSEAKDEVNNLQAGEIVLLENLRFDSREESNDENFVKSLAELGEFYVNEAFAVSHRTHASIVGLPKLIPHAAGLHFEKEISNLGKVLENKNHPVISLISGVKEDKLSYVNDFKKFSDKILVGGRLPDLIGDEDPLRKDSKVLVANLIPDKEDITIHSIESFEKEVSGAKMTILSGPLGKFEEEGHMLGTKRVFEKIAESSSFKIAGGGNTESAIAKLELDEKFDWISVGGGAMLEFLAKGTLPGIEALLE